MNLHDQRVLVTGSTAGISRETATRIASFDKRRGHRSDHGLGWRTVRLPSRSRYPTIATPRLLTG